MTTRITPAALAARAWGSGKRRLLTGAVVGVAALAAAAAGVAAMSGDRPTSVHVAAGGGESAAVVEEPSTVPMETPVAPATVPAVVATTTTARPVTTTTVTTNVPDLITTTSRPQPPRARIWVDNRYGAPVSVRLFDGDERTWALVAGASEGPWEMATSDEHGDGGQVARADDNSCGAGDSDNYFQAGHDYRVVVEQWPDHSCADGGPAPHLVVNDLTAGTTVAVD